MWNFFLITEGNVIWLYLLTFTKGMFLSYCDIVKFTISQWKIMSS